MDHSVASRHLGYLQSRLGVRLVETSRKGVCVTDAGRRYSEQVGAALTSIAQATAGMRVTSPRPLEIWCVDGLATQWLIPRLPEFYRCCPTIDLLLRPTDAIPDFKDTRVAAKIHFGRLRQPGVTVTELVRPPVYAVASPEWIEAHPAVRAPSDLIPLALIHDESRDRWRDWFIGCGLTPPHLSGHCLWNAAAAMEAAICGQGVALANSLICQDAVARGRLCHVFDTAIHLEPYVLLARDDTIDPQLAAFKEWMLSKLGADQRAS